MANKSSVAVVANSLGADLQTRLNLKNIGAYGGALFLTKKNGKPALKNALFEAIRLEEVRHVILVSPTLLDAAEAEEIGQMGEEVEQILYYDHG